MSEDGLKKTNVISHGQRTAKFNLNEDVDYPNRSVELIVSTIHEYTKDMGTNELAQFSKRNYLFENTEYNKPMKFQELAEALDSYPERKEELEEIMPAKNEGVDVSDLLPLGD